MMYANPWYSNASYNPYAYQRYSPFEQIQQQERARAVAEQRARRAQWLPHEVGDDDDWEDEQLGVRERAMLEAQRGQAIMEERRRQQEREEEAARQRFLEERKKQIQRAREEEARRAAAALEFERRLRAQQQQARAQAGARASSQSRQERKPTSPFARTPTPQRQSGPTQAQSPSPQSKSPQPKSPTPKSIYTEKHADAASVIQQHYRIHQSHRALDDIASKFDSLKTGFVYPSTIDFQRPGSQDEHITVSAVRPASDYDNVDSDEEETTMDVDGEEGKLAYTSLNVPLHAYTDAMDKLLMKLDGVESWGKKEIRDRRRAIVHDIAKESAKLDRYWKQAWSDHLQKQKEEDEPQQDVTLPQSEQEIEEEKGEVSEEQQSLSAPEVEEMSVDPEPEVEIDPEQQPLDSSSGPLVEEPTLESHEHSSPLVTVSEEDEEYEEPGSPSLQSIPDDELPEVSTPLPLEPEVEEPTDEYAVPQQVLSSTGDVAQPKPEDEQEEVEVEAVLEEPVEVEKPEIRDDASPRVRVASADEDANLDEWAMI